ncbi:Uncharacterised protein [Lysinibacillus capsici]|uniref:Uncharacterized protein n=1 Tax=Lysinibacillus capsici TaxID=2115968 RepID=A0A2X0Y1E9_9BACI|nr:Uncharacterised protein [Lysinibacillus capsici]
MKYDKQCINNEKDVAVMATSSILMGFTLFV